ncbi:MAG: YdeI/OmpD-associated family protein [bacterium]
MAGLTDLKRLDEETYLRKFTPRKLNSKWSPTNIAQAEKMLTAGQMQATGKKAYEHFLQSGKRPVKSKVSDKSIKLPLYLIKVLKKNLPAWTFFNQISPSQQRRYIAWITSPQKTETKYGRLNQAIKKLEHRQLLGLK